MRAALLALAVLVAPGLARAEDAHPMFRWPLTGKPVPAPAGHGLDIVAPLGLSVHAAADGSVLYAGDEIKSFGQMVVVRHADDYVSVYAYLSGIVVKRGDAIRRGQILGKSGKSGDAPRPELHFELRKGETALDPLGYLGAR